MKITEAQAKEALEKLYLNAVGGIGMGQFKESKNLLSTLIDQHFKRKKEYKGLLDWLHAELVRKTTIDWTGE